MKNNTLDHTLELVELIRESVPNEFIKVIKRTRKFLYLIGNTYHSVPQEIQSLVWDWFKEQGISVPSELIITNVTELGTIQSKIKTFPSFSTKKKHKNLFVYAFPKQYSLGVWSPMVSSLNVLLKEHQQTVTSIIPYLDDLKYVISPMKEWNKPFNLCTEMYISDIDWILFNSTEINEKILRQNLYKF